MDKIIIKDLFLRCIIGINEEERREKQDVIINVILWTDLRKAGKSDKFENTLDYRYIKKQIVDIVESSNYYLVEALAEKIANICLEDERVRKVQVVVEKPGALRFARSVGVEITREKK